MEFYDNNNNKIFLCKNLKVKIIKYQDKILNSYNILKEVKF